MFGDIFFRKKRNRNCLEYLEIHLTDHCNLNCACCCHFAPLARQYYMTLEVFKRDIERLAFLSGGNIKRIRLMGGEPLLHPQIKEFMKIARLCFPKYEIAIHSNGILLDNMDEEFWRVCSANRIDIVLSYYPINIDYTLISRLSVKNNVVLKIEIDTSKKMFRNFKMDLRGSQNYRKSWHHCTHANASVNLYEGKLYSCDITTHSKHLSNYFNIPLEYTNKDYVDIYKETSMRDVLKKLNLPHPFCKYCCPNDSEIIEWCMSKNELTEWAKV